MVPILIACLLLFASAQSDKDGPSVDNSPKTTINGTAEYSALCRTCPYNICTHSYQAKGGEASDVTCWTHGDLVGDTDLWLKTSKGCYLAEYDLIEYEGDFSAELEYCGHIPLTVTQERSTVRYLSECLYGYETGDEAITYYDRDVDITVTCWAEGKEVMGDPYWYKTLDYCWVSGSGLWDKPDRDSLEWCGPPISRRVNETVEPLPTDGKKPIPLPTDEDGDGGEGLVRRWLSSGQVSEEYAGCYACPRFFGNETCDLVTAYEFNQTVVSQCATTYDLTVVWMYTTDWCYVNGTKFWTEPWHHTGYPHCRNWDL